MQKGDSSPLRTKVCRLAHDDWKQAAAIAENMSDPWYACQAFAACGRFAPEVKSRRFIDQAFAFARAGCDFYQRVAATAWPLRALIERERSAEAIAAFESIAKTVDDVEPVSSRAEACFLLFQAMVVGPPDIADRALEWLFSTVRPEMHWRAGRAIREATLQALTIAILNPKDVPDHIGNTELASKIVARFNHGVQRFPRSFFRRD